ncbi:unnamed protein product [Cylicocyclus nassatus]|uniref:Uncharacterized protein n=1 Tax=Cylicocyclus nassatus TaxID=53992 RepID=A0AA36GHT4_CYLNA|nr:unnamed protein product [Cylicocyclus nassatus]
MDRCSERGVCFGLSGNEFKCVPTEADRVEWELIAGYPSRREDAASPLQGRRPERRGENCMASTDSCEWCGGDAHPEQSQDAQCRQ